MAIEIKVPRLGWSMEEGTFVEWLKRDGELVRPGEPLFALEGDKAIQEIESIGSGILRIAPHGPENGETVLVGALLAVLVEAGETAAFGQPASVAAADVPRRAEAAPSVVGGSSERQPIFEPHGEATSSNPIVRSDGRPRISPRAARVAGELDVEVARVKGTGKNGRIRERDIRASAARNVGRPAATAGDRTGTAANLPGFRRTIAARMAEGAHSAAPVTLTTSADATNLVSLRSQFKAAVTTANGFIPSFTDVVIKLAARALGEHPALNQQWIDGRIESPEGIHVAIAIDTPSGLLAPVVRDVPGLGLREIATRTADLKERALASRLKPEELRDGTFTVTNLGAYGIDAFTPIINVPQCAILGLGRIVRRPEVVGDQIVPRDMLTLSLTFDHRIVDGAPAARFLATLRAVIENPGPWLVF
jgi:pyruvate dehydrogenase E2 component (dihydrolipoamide acetyltransferase)